MFLLLATGHTRDLVDPGVPDMQMWWQTGAVLVCVMAATAWLTARWLIRRKKGCAGDCSRCVAGGAATTPGPGACGHTHGGTGIRSDSLRVVRSGGPPAASHAMPTNLPSRSDV